MAMEAPWLPKPSSLGLALGREQRAPGLPELLRIRHKCPRHCLGTRSLMPADGDPGPQVLGGNALPSISPPFARGRETVQSMLERDSSSLPRFLSLILKHKLHVKAFPPGDLKCWFQPFLGNPTAPDSL